MTKAEVIDRLRTTRGELEALLAAMTPEQMRRPGVAGDWSVKDVLAHILWYAREELELVRESGAAASALWDVAQDPRNGLIREELRDQPLDDVLTELRQVFEAFVVAVDGLSDADMVTP